MRRYNCQCGKKRYRDEPAALVAAADDRRAFGEPVTVYRCPGGLAWHLTSRGFTPEALPTTGRRLAYELLTRGEAPFTNPCDDAQAGDSRRDRAGAREPGAGRPGASRRRRCAERMTALGIARWDGPARLEAVDRVALARVVQVGLDGYAEERAAGTTRTAATTEPGGLTDAGGA